MPPHESSSDVIQFSNAKPPLYPKNITSKNTVDKLLLRCQTDNDILRWALMNYTPPDKVEAMLTHIWKRGSPDYVQDKWIMCLDDSNQTPYPDWVLEMITAEYFMGTSSEQILKQIILKLDEEDLKSLSLVL